MQSLGTRALRLEKFNLLLKTAKERIEKKQLKLPKFVKIVEVGPRDGLQNEKTIVPTVDKIDFINKLSKSGLKTIEVTSFVSPKWVPQMADNTEVYNKIEKSPSINYPVLVPNLAGLDNALKAGVKEIAIFGAASETFSKKNINCSISESLEKFSLVINEAKKHNLLIRGYISCVMGCPYEGEISPEKVHEVAKKMYDLGCYEISLGDTVGLGNPEKTAKLFDTITSIPVSKLAAHFHDTYDTALENLLVALDKGVSVIDSSISGLGGCPYAKKSAGNVCTENVVGLLHALGVETGINLEKLKEIGEEISKKLGRENMSLV